MTFTSTSISNLSHLERSLVALMTQKQQHMERQIQLARCALAENLKLATPMSRKVPFGSYNPCYAKGEQWVTSSGH